MTLQKRLADLERRRGPGRVYVRTPSGDVWIEGQHYPAGHAPEPAENDIQVEVTGGYRTAEGTT